MASKVKVSFTKEFKDNVEEFIKNYLNLMGNSVPNNWHCQEISSSSFYFDFDFYSNLVRIEVIVDPPEGEFSFSFNKNKSKITNKMVEYFFENSHWDEDDDFDLNWIIPNFKKVLKAFFELSTMYEKFVNELDEHEARYFDKKLGESVFSFMEKRKKIG